MPLYNSLQLALLYRQSLSWSRMPSIRVEVGVHCRSTQERTGGIWLPQDCQDHINKSYTICPPPPPFSLIGSCFQKVSKEEVPSLLLIAPVWPAQSWYPFIVGDANRSPTSTATELEHTAEPSGRSSPIGDSRPSQTSQMANIRMSFSSRGLSQQTQEIYCASWRKSTTRSYD